MGGRPGSARRVCFCAGQSHGNRLAAPPRSRAARAAAARAPPRRELRRLTLARRARLRSGRAARVSGPAGWRGFPAGRVRRAGAAPAAHPRPQSAAGLGTRGRRGPGQCCPAAGRGAGEVGARAALTPVLFSPPSRYPRLRPSPLPRSRLTPARPLRSGEGARPWRPSCVPGPANPPPGKLRRDPGRTGRQRCRRAGVAQHSDSGRAGRRAAVPSLRPACLAFLRGAELGAARRCRGPALSEHGPGTEGARRGAGGGRAVSSGAEMSGAGASACFAFALREGHLGPAASAASPAARPESRFGSGLVPFGEGSGRPCGTKGIRCLLLPTRPTGLGRDAGGEGAAAAARLGADPSGGGSGEPPRPQRFLPILPTARVPKCSGQKPLKGLFKCESRHGSQPHRTATAEEGRALPTAN